MSFKSIGQVANYKPLASCGMDEIAAWVRSVDPTGGILFARNADGEGKREARQAILDLFTPQAWPQHLNMLTMPGMHWRFERLLLASREGGWMHRRHPHRTHFTGVENDRAIYFAGATKMPGVETPGRWIKPVKRDRFPFAEMAIKTRYASFFFANVDDVLLHQWERPQYREEAKLGWDAVWLDYTGPLTVKRLAKIQRFYETYVRVILVLTVLKARWDRHTSAAIRRAGGHSEWVIENLNGEVLHNLEYFDTSPMAQIAIRKAP